LQVNRPSDKGGKPYFLVKILKTFRNTPYQYCFEPPWIAYNVKVEDPVWTPNTEKVPEYVKAVNIWIKLSTEVEDPYLHTCLLTHIDYHLQNIYNINKKGIAKFVYEDICCNKITKNLYSKIIMDVLPPIKSQKHSNKILHLLSKALPQRCQIRNLREIIVQYTMQDDDVFMFLITILKNSLFGTYDHCKSKLNFEGRYILYEAFVNQLKIKTFFVKWFQSGSQHQIHLFYCLKEFLVDAVFQCHPTFEIVEKKYNWSKFSNQVTAFMDKTRDALILISRREYKFMERSDWMHCIEQILNSAAKQHIKLFRTNPIIGYHQKLKSQILKYFMMQGKHKCDEFIPLKIQHLLWKLTQRFYKIENVIRLLHSILNVPKDVVDSIIEEKFGQQDFDKHSLQTLEYIMEICRMVLLHKNTTVYVLPQHIYEAQKKAIELKMKVDMESDKGLFLDQCIQRNICKNSSINYLCFVCNDSKVFLMKETKNSRHSNKLARGSLRVVVDNTQDQLRYVCGKRPERHTKNGKRKWRDDPKLQQRKLNKEKQRDSLADRCINTPLVEIDLLGNAFSFQGKLMILCSLCANATILNNLCYNHNVLPNCKICSAHLKKICHMCKQENICNNVLALDSKVGMFCSVPFCTSCANQHASQQPVLI